MTDSQLRRRGASQPKEEAALTESSNNISDEEILRLKTETRNDIADPKKALLLAEAYAERGQVDDAVKSLKKAMNRFDKFRNNFEIVYTLGCYQLDAQNGSAAEREFETAVKLQPMNSDAHYALSEARMMMGDVGRSINSLRRAHRLKPQDFDILVALGVKLGLSNDEGVEEEAVKYLDKALAVKPGNMQALVARGDALLRAKRHEEALNHAEAWEKQLDSSQPYERCVFQRQQCDALTGLGQPDLAVGKGEEALAGARALGDDHPRQSALCNAHAVLCEALIKGKKYDQALEQFKTFTTESPIAIHLHIKIKSSLSDLGFEKEATEIFEAAADRDPTMRKLADAYKQVQDAEKNATADRLATEKRSNVTKMVAAGVMFSFGLIFLLIR